MWKGQIRNQGYSDCQSVQVLTPGTPFYTHILFVNAVACTLHDINPNARLWLRMLFRMSSFKFRRERERASAIGFKCSPPKNHLFCHICRALTLVKRRNSKAVSNSVRRFVSIFQPNDDDTAWQRNSVIFCAMFLYELRCLCWSTSSCFFFKLLGSFTNIGFYEHVCPTGESEISIGGRTGGGGGGGHPNLTLTLAHRCL